MKEQPDGGVRFVVPARCATSDAEERLFDLLAGIPSSWSRNASGDLMVWTAAADAAEADAVLQSTFEGISRAPEAPRDWVAEAAALRRSVVVGRYLLDPHEGGSATRAAPGQVRLSLPAARAFGTGSHESTRLAIRLLLGEELPGRRVLDVGCGAGTLAFVAALEGAAAVAFDIDPDAALAAREQALVNRIPRLSVFAGPLEALRRTTRFDLIVANMLLGEVVPLLPGLRTRLSAGGRLLSSGLLVEQTGEWEERLLANGLRVVSAMTENEWMGTAAEPFE